MVNICLKSKKKLNFTECICAATANERLERMDILNNQNTESVILIQGLKIKALKFDTYRL